MALGENLSLSNLTPNSGQSEPVPIQLLRELQIRSQAFDRLAIISETDLYGTITYANKKFCEVSQYSESELIGKPHNIIRHPSTPKEVFKQMWDTIKQGEVFQAIIRNRRKDGTSYWVDTTVSPVFDENGKIYKYLGIRIDITDRLLREIEFESLVETLNNTHIVLEFNSTGYIAKANSLACRLLGYSQEELIGAHHKILCQESFVNSVDYQAFWVELNSGKTQEDTYKFVKKDGGYLWFDATYASAKSQSDSADNRIVMIAQDATERREANSENRGKLAAISESNAVLEMDLQGKIIYANDYCLETLGYTLEKLTSLHHRDLLDEAYAQSQDYQQLWNKLKSGVADKEVYNFVCQDSSEVWIEGTYNPIRNYDGEVFKIVMYGFDVTERRLANSENRAKLAAINATNFVMEFGLDAKVLYANQIALEALGFDNQEVIGKPHKVLCPLDYIESGEYDLLWAKLNSGQSVTAEVRRLSKSGQEIWLSSTYTVINDLKDRPFKVVKYAQIITDRKVLEQQTVAQLEETRKREIEISLVRKDLEARLSGLDAAAILSESDLYGNIIYANSKLCEVSQYTLEEMIGRPHSMLRHPATPKETFRQLWETIKSGKIFQATYRNRRKDGSAYWVDATIGPVFDDKGHTIKYFGIRIDVTKRIENQVEVEGQFEAIGRSNALIEFDLQGRILSANSYVLERLGYDSDELRGKPLQSILLADTAKDLQTNGFFQRLEQGEYFKDTYRFVAKNKEYRWFDGSYNPIKDVDSQVFKINFIGNDATERRVANSENRGKLAAIDKSYLVVELDLSGNFLKANEGFCQLFGYSESELTAMQHRQICEPDYVRSAEYQKLWAELRQGIYQSGEYKRIAKDGSVVWLQATYNPIQDYDGNYYKVVKYSQDITDFKLAFNALSDFLLELQKGNFNAQINLGDLKLRADIASMIRSNTALRDNLKTIISEISKVVAAAAQEGRLTERLSIAGLEGSWKELSELINNLLDSISEPIYGVKEIVEALASGDLTKRFTKTASGDIKSMSDALNSALQNLNRLLLEVKNSTATVDISANQMLEKYVGMERDTTSVIAEIKQISAGTTEQVQRTDESSKLVDAILKASTDTGEKARIINTSAEIGVQNSNSGMNIVSKLVNNMTEIATSADSTFKSIEILTRRSEEISRTLSVIKEIASQTNLLALNAAIEAARAGDAGRGFAVVAEEIRKLAEDSRRSAVEIDQVIQDVQKDVAQAGKAIDRMESNVKTGNQATQEVSSVFGSILESSKETFRLSRDVLEAAEAQKSSIGVVVKNIEKIVVVSEETASGTVNVLKSGEQLSNSVSSIGQTSKNLSALAGDLRLALEKFKLES